MSNNSTSSGNLPDSAWVFYYYTPSYSLPIACAAVFGALLFIHLGYAVVKRTVYMWPFIIGVLAWIHPVGKQEGLGLYIGQNLCIILAPACMAATLYMIFGRVISYVSPKYSPISPRWVTGTFVTFDVLSFVIQGAGGSLYSSDNKSLYNVAKGILIAGFLIQVLSFGIFLSFSIVYQVRARKAGEPDGPWCRLLYTLYLGCTLILIRSIFRTIEFAQGDNSTGYLLTHEVFYYCLETLPIVLCVILFVLSHPSLYIPSDKHARMQSALPSQKAQEDQTVAVEHLGQDHLAQDRNSDLDMVEVEK